MPSVEMIHNEAKNLSNTIEEKQNKKTSYFYKNSAGEYSYRYSSDKN